MNYSKFLILILLLSIGLEAAYTRSIRVTTQYSQKSSNQEVKKLNKFISSQKNLVRLQNKWGFKALSQKSGKYYLNVIEPIDNKQVLREVLKTIRTRYPDAYSKKIEKAIAVPKPIVKVVPKIEEAPKVQETSKLNEVAKVKVASVTEVVPIEEVTPMDESIIAVEEVIVVEEEVVEVKKTEPKVVKKPVVKEKVVEEKITEKVIVQEKIKEEILVEESKELITSEDSSQNMWKMSFFIMSLLFFIVLILLLLSKKKNRKIRKKERNAKMENKEKDIHYSSHIRNNENFLAEAQTLMSSVIQYSNLLLEFDLSVIQKDYVQRIRSSSESLLNVVNNTSDISKIQVGELEMKAVDFNLRNMIGDVSNIISLEANQNHVDLIVDIHEDIPAHVIGDSIHLKQVLISLLTNSVKYTRDGEVTLTLKKVYSYSHAITLSFIISDTGIGMSPEQIDGIARAAKNNTSTNLSVSKQLIQRMNGDMKVYSTLGVGSTFTFNIKFDLQQ